MNTNKHIELIESNLAEIEALGEKVQTGANNEMNGNETRLHELTVRNSYYILAILEDAE